MDTIDSIQINKNSADESSFLLRTLLVDSKMVVSKEVYEYLM